MKEIPHYGNKLWRSYVFFAFLIFVFWLFWGDAKQELFGKSAENNISEIFKGDIIIKDGKFFKYNGIQDLDLNIQFTVDVNDLHTYLGNMGFFEVTRDQTYCPNHYLNCDILVKTPRFEFFKHEKEDAVIYYDTKDKIIYFSATNYKY